MHHLLHLAISPVRLANFPTIELRSPGSTSVNLQTRQRPTTHPNILLGSALFTLLSSNLDTKPPFATTTVLSVIPHPPTNNIKPRLLRNRYVSPYPLLASPCTLLPAHPVSSSPSTASLLGTPSPFFFEHVELRGTTIAPKTPPGPGNCSISTASYARSL